MLIVFDYFVILWSKEMDNINNMVIIIFEEDEMIIIRRRLQDRHNSYNPKVSTTTESTTIQQ